MIVVRCPVTTSRQDFKKQGGCHLNQQTCKNSETSKGVLLSHGSWVKSCRTQDEFAKDREVERCPAWTGHKQDRQTLMSGHGGMPLVRNAQCFDQPADLTSSTVPWDFAGEY